MVPTRITREARVDAPVDRVWDVLTSPEHIAGWFGDSASVELRPGGEMALGWAAYGDFRAVVTKVEAPRNFAFRWAAEPDVDPMQGNSTLVEFTLSPEGSITVLTVVETGFRLLARPAEAQAEHAEENAKGWEQELAELKAYAEK
ncbi:SRPBCC family protein [Phytomonospora sp. NPDC050363]|uniref:SRPBCC family protein n=1 Tax=Phytomonospora sp. NPDC050363 TaxID=3155642 RepID=UPI0033E7F12B